MEWLIDFDLFVATNFLAPATNHPDRVVPIVHDLAFRHFPESAPHIDERWRRRFAATLAVAPAIVVPSAATAKDLLDAFAVDEARVHVVHHGVEAEAFAPVPQAGDRRGPPALRHPRCATCCSSAASSRGRTSSAW